MNLQEKLLSLKAKGVEPKAVAYARFSSENQREESVDAQIRAVNEFAAANGLVIVKHYIDKARSGTSDDREQFQQMIADAADGNFNFVIVHKLDRFARNRRDSMGYRIQLRKSNVDLLSVLERFDDETPEGKLMEGMIELLAEFYSQNLAREVKKGLKENALKAMHTGGTAPYGYDIDEKTKKLVINPHEAEGVKIIFKMILEHYSYNDIIDRLNELGFSSRRGNPLRKTSLYEILRNPKYMGIYFYRRGKPKDYYTKSRNNHEYNLPEKMIIVPDGVPAIISKEDFEKVQEILNKRKKHKVVRKKEKYLLAGKIICGVCGAAFSGNRKKTPNSDKPYVTYRCNNRRYRTGISCKNKEVNRDALETAVLEYLADTVFDSKIIPKIFEQFKQEKKLAAKKSNLALEDLKKQLKKIEHAIENILRAIEASDSLILLNRLKTLEKEKEQLHQKIMENEIKDENADFDFSTIKQVFNQAKVMFKNGTLEEAQQLISMFLDKVIVYEDRVEFIFNAVPFYLKKKYPKIHYQINRNLVRLKQRT